MCSPIFSILILPRKSLRRKRTAANFEENWGMAVGGGGSSLEGLRRIVFAGLDNEKYNFRGPLADSD